MDIQAQIRTYVAGAPEKTPILQRAFEAFGDPEVVDAALASLVSEGILLEEADGVFGKAMHTKFGPWSGFGPWEIAKALAEADGHQIGRIALEWANLLHLSRQVVAEVVFLTDGPDRVIRNGNRTIRLEHASPEEVRLSQTLAGGAVLGLPHADGHPQESIRILHRLFKPADWAAFLREAKAQGGWIARAVTVYQAALGREGSKGATAGPLIVLFEVEPNPDGPWDADTELELGVFNSKAEAIHWLEAMLIEEGWSETEWRHWPAFGTQGSRFQLQERAKATT